MSSQPGPESSAAGGQQRGGEPSEEELRAAYEAELSRVTCAEVMLQTAVSLLNLGGRRLGPAGGPAAEAQPPAAGPRDLEQVRDAIDGVRALLDVLERRLPNELGQLRDALAQLQVAYAREVQAGAGPARATHREAGAAGEAAAGSDEGPRPGGAGQKSPDAPDRSKDDPGPAEASGKLWVPGR
jgi:hypothetical protein